MSLLAQSLGTIEELVREADVTLPLLQNDTTGIFRLRLPQYDCELGLENWYVVDWSGDGVPDLIYNGDCRPYPQVGIFLQTPEGWELVYQTAGNLRELERRPKGAVITVFSEAIGCLTSHCLRRVNLNPDGQLGEVTTLYWQPETTIPMAASFRPAQLHGILRSEAFESDTYIEADECFGQPALGNHIANVWQPREGLLLFEDIRWQLVCLPLATDTWQVGWIAQSDLEMSENENTLRRLYQGFQMKDFRQMASCYHDSATFEDPVFQLKNGKEVRAMWHYLIANGKDLAVEFSDIKADGNHGTAHWEARYSFSLTGRKVHNIIDGQFEFKDGLIIRHRDRFSFWRWSRQALGASGVLLGWTPLVKGKVRKTAMGGLKKFIAEHPEYQ